MSKLSKASAFFLLALLFAFAGWAEEAAEVEAAPEIAEITVPADRTLGVGETYLLPVSYSPAEAENTLTYASKDKKIATVDENGLVAAKKAGKTKITVSAASGVTATCKITVKAAPKSVSLNQSSLTLGVGQEFSFRYTLSKGSAGSVSYESSDAAVLSVDDAGTATALFPGTATVTARAYNGKKARCTVKVLPAPASVAFDEAALTLGVGMRVTPAVSISAGSACGFSFESSDAAVAAVDGDGRVSAAGVGTATITVRTHNGLSATCEVTVKAAPSKIALDPKKLTIGVKESAQLTVIPGEAGEDCFGSYSFSSGNAKIAAVSSDGKVTGKRAGTTTITVKSHNGKKATCKVTVTKAPASVSLGEKTMTLGVGEARTLGYTLSKGSSGQVTLRSSDPAVATVDASGRIEAVAQGTATVTAETYNGKKATCAVTVMPAPEGVSLSETNLTLCAGEKRTLTATLTAGSAGACAFESSDASVIGVDQKGRLTAKAAGSATITVRTYNGFEAACAVTVEPAPTSVRFSSKSVTMGVGETLKLEISFGGGATSAGCTFSVKSKSVATVSADGTVTAKKAGKTTITVKTYNGKTATCTVNVGKAPASVSLNFEYLYMGLGETYQLKATVPGGGAGGVTWTSSDETLVSVDESGVLTAHALSWGVTITATTYNGKSASCGVGVFGAPTSVRVNASNKYIEGKTDYFHAQVSGGRCVVVSVTSSDPSVLEIVPGDDPTWYTAIPKKGGTVTLTARTYNGLTDTQEVTVEGGPTSVSIKLPDTLVYGYKYNLNYFVRFQPSGLSADHIKSFSISNKKVIGWDYMDHEGRWIAPTGLGSATITVVTWNGKTVRKTVKVYYKKGYTIETTDGQIEECPYMPVQ